MGGTFVLPSSPFISPLERILYSRTGGHIRGFSVPSLPGTKDAAGTSGEGESGTEQAGSKSGASGSEAAATARITPESGANHLIVLVHGLGGRPADMSLMRGYLQALMPGAEVRPLSLTSFRAVTRLKSEFSYLLRALLMYSV